MYWQASSACTASDSAPRAVALEAGEVREPRVDASRTEQDLAEILVRGGVRRLRLEHALVGGDGSVGRALLLEQHAEIEMGGGEVGPEAPARAGRRARLRPSLCCICSATPWL